MFRPPAALLLAVLVLVATAQGAGAHAMLSESDPADGALLESPPDEVLLSFTEPVDPALTRVEVRDSHGQPVDSEAERLAAEPTRVRVTLPGLDEGTYTVTYHALSTVDGHVTTGTVAFGVGVDQPVATMAEPAEHGFALSGPSALAVVGRWALYWGLALLLAAAVIGLAVFSGRVPGARWALVPPLALATVGLLVLAVAESHKAGVDLAQLLSSSAGFRLLREAIALGLTAVAVALAVARPSRTMLVLLGVLGAVTMLAHTLGGHAGAPGDLRWVNIAVHWLHIVSVGIWIGGLVWLVVGLRAWDRTDRPAAVRRFSNVAAVVLVPVALTGAQRALDLAGGWSGLVGTDYGRTVLVKVALFLPLVAIGALNRFRVVPALSRGEDRTGLLRRTVGSELWFAAGVLGVTAVMAGLPPPSPASHAMAGGPRIQASGNDFATSVRATLTATPGTAGPNRFDLRIADYDSGEPLAARRVSLHFSLPERPQVGSSSLDLTEAGPGRWTGTGTPMSVVGRWHVAVAIEQADDSVEVPLVLRPRAAPGTGEPGGHGDGGMDAGDG